MSETGETPGREVRRALYAHINAATLFSLAYNVLLLVSPLYMLQVYDRVLASGSVETLILLTLLTIFLFGIYAAADAGRRRVFSLMGERLGRLFERRVFAGGLAAGGTVLETQAVNLGRVQALFGGGVIQPLFDAPFAPLFAVAVFLIHPVLGWLTVGGAVVLILLALAAERAAEPLVGDTARREAIAGGYLGGIARSDGVVRSLGMASGLEPRWRMLRAGAAEAALDAGRSAGRYGSTSRALRQMLQSLVLGTAAWLVLKQEVSAGAIIASSVLSGRVLGPIDGAIAGWRPFLKGREAWRALQPLLRRREPADAATPLPRPQGPLVAHALEVAPPGATAGLLKPMELVLDPGTVMLVVGPSGIGKSTLLATLAGAALPFAGRVALGGRDIHGWDATDRGRWFGYQPQTGDLLPGSVRENIERMRRGPDEAVFTAAGAVGVHEAILALPHGYDTLLGPGGAPLSIGGRQGVALARAVYGDPVLLIFDEPSANLDAAGAAALANVMRASAREGRILVIATHDGRLLAAATDVLELSARGSRRMSRDEYLRQTQPVTLAKAS